MKQITIIKPLLLGLVLCSSQVCWAATGIPNQFQGKWGSSDSCKNMGEGPTRISAKEFKGQESSCVLKKVLKSDDLNFEGNFTCSGEGEHWEDKISLKRAGDKIIINNGEPTPKCK